MALLAVSCLSAPTPAVAAPQLILPTPAGEAWVVIQGYACGTHNAWDRYSLDLVQVDGPTYDAPVRAAAGGQVWHWESGSGTLILRHDGNFFTMYTHMGRAVSTQPGRFFEAGETLGYAGDRGAPGVPHLHFTAYTANGDGWSGKQSQPLRFAEGYDLPEIGGCSQHQGTRLTAMALQPPAISFSSPAQPGAWYASDQQIAFAVQWGGKGLSQAWDAEPAADAPMFPGHTDGYAMIGDLGEGMHTLKVRAWGPDGRQTLAEYGPVGFDISPPSNPPAIGELHGVAGAAFDLSWPAGSDRHAGLAGYRVYIGADPAGHADWFSPEPRVTAPPLASGSYLLRVQTLDRAGNTSAWATIATIIVE